MAKINHTQRLGIVLLLLLSVASALPTAARLMAAGTEAIAMSTDRTMPSPRRSTAPVGSRIITRADQGEILHLAVGETFLLKLGDGTWDIQITQPQVVTPDDGATPSSGHQGIYRASAPGLTELVAVAVPDCIKDLSHCRVMAPAFRLLIVVR